MNINGVGNNYNRYTDAYKKQEKAAAKPQKKTDKLELSDAAKKLKSLGVDSKDFAAVKAKINSGYYTTQEVTNKVAEAILKEISENE